MFAWLELGVNVLRSFEGGNSLGVVCGPGTQTNLLDAVVDWCDCLHGRAPVTEGIYSLCEALGGTAVVLSRLRATGSSAARVVAADCRTKRRSASTITRSFAQSLLRDYAERSRAGSIWFSSMFDNDLALDLAEFQRTERFQELAVIPLTVSEKYIDFLEIHFAEKLNIDQINVLNTFVRTLVKTWASRSPGLFVDASLSQKTKLASGDRGADLLSDKNPARLSRAEYRVCMLISHGLHTGAIEKELCISTSTLRSHLRNIYAKTNATSQSELTYMLLSPNGAPSATTAQKYSA